MKSNLLRQAKYGDRLFLVYQDPDDKNTYQIDGVKVVWEATGKEGSSCIVGVVLINFFGDKTIRSLHDTIHESGESTYNKGLAGIFANRDEAVLYISQLKE